MALFILEIECALCGQQVINGNDGIVFPAFIMNQADSLYVFNDAVTHKTCFYKHPMYSKMVELLGELNTKITPQKRICGICQERITNPDDYISFTCMSSDKLNPLSLYNFKQYHKSCFVDSEDSQQIKKLISQQEKDKRWIGKLEL